MSTELAWEKWLWRDWKSDPAVRKLTAASRAIWFEMLGDMWLEKSHQWSGDLADIVQVANASDEDVDHFLVEAKATGVCDISVTVTECHTHVTVVCRRKQREEKDRESARLRQRRARAKKAGHALSQGESESESESESEKDQDPDLTPPPDPYRDPTGERVAETSAPPCPPNCPHQKILELYHEKCPTLPRVKVLSERRQQFTRQRWREILDGRDPAAALEWFGRFFERVSESPFLTGQIANGERRPFVADYEWVMRPNNFLKIYEGRYDG